MGRTLIWIEESTFRGWGCSACAWVFNPSGPPTGDSIEEMKHDYVRQCEADFAAHVCAGPHRPPKKAPRT